MCQAQNNQPGMSALKASRSLSMLDRRLGRGLTIYTLLMVASALSEGLGIVLLVPMLAALGPAGAGNGQIPALLAKLGLPFRLEPLLSLFVTLGSGPVKLLALRLIG